MTTSVTLKTRAWPATVTVTPEGAEATTHDVAPHGTLDLHLSGDNTIRVTEREPTAGEGETVVGEEKVGDKPAEEPVPQFRRGAARQVDEKAAEEA